MPQGLKPSDTIHVSLRSLKESKRLQEGILTIMEFGPLLMKHQFIVTMTLSKGKICHLLENPCRI